MTAYEFPDVLDDFLQWLDVDMSAVLRRLEKAGRSS